MGAISRTRTFPRNRPTELAKDVRHRRRIGPPRRLVEINHGKTYRIIRQERIAPQSQRLPCDIHPAKMRFNGRIVQRAELPRRTRRAIRLSACLPTNSTHPLDGTHRRIATLPRLRILPPPSIDVFASAKHCPKQRHFLGRRGIVRNRPLAAIIQENLHCDSFFPNVVFRSTRTELTRYPTAIIASRL